MTVMLEQAPNESVEVKVMTREELENILAWFALTADLEMAEEIVKQAPSSEALSWHDLQTQQQAIEASKDAKVVNEGVAYANSEVRNNILDETAGIIDRVLKPATFIVDHVAKRKTGSVVYTHMRQFAGQPIKVPKTQTLDPTKVVDSHTHFGADDPRVAGFVLRIARWLGLDEARQLKSFALIGFRPRPEDEHEEMRKANPALYEVHQDYERQMERPGVISLASLVGHNAHKSNNGAPGILRSTINKIVGRTDRGSQQPKSQEAFIRDMVLENYQAEHASFELDNELLKWAMYNALRRKDHPDLTELVNSLMNEYRKSDIAQHEAPELA